MKEISRLQFITTDAALAEKACLGGVRWIQLRLKKISDSDFLTIAGEVQEVCKQFDAKLIINDNVAIAKKINADGVHLGKDDMHPADARIILGDNRIIGCTANSRNNIVKLAAFPIDYIGLGPLRFTATKEKISSIIGIKGYQRILDSIYELSVTTPPIIAIGGVTEKDIVSLLQTGVHGVAVSGAIANSADVTESAKKFVSTFHSIQSLKLSEA